MNKKMSAFVLLLFVMSHACHVSAQTAFEEKTVDALALLPSAAALTKAISDGDKDAVKQIGISTLAVIASNYALEAAIRKQRPDGSGRHSFPSTHTAAAFNGATALFRRYGYKWGIPAYAVSAYVAYERVHAKKHDVWDVLGGATLGTACALLFVKKKPKPGAPQLSVAPLTLDEKTYAVEIVLRY